MAQVEMTIDSVRRIPPGWDRWVVVLKAKLAEHYLPIYVGQYQADIIKRLLMGIVPHELPESDLPLTGLDIANYKVESVLISRFEDNIFYARLFLSQHGKPCDVDCPLALALALAVRAGAPIFAEETVLNKAGIAVEA